MKLSGNMAVVRSGYNPGVTLPGASRRVGSTQRSHTGGVLTGGAESLPRHSRRRRRWQPHSRRAGSNTRHAWRCLSRLSRRASLLLLCTVAPLVWAAQPVSVNLADAAGIAAGLPGIGEVKAAAIVAERQRTGPFTQPTDLLRVNGIGARLLQRIESYLLFDTAAATGSSQQGESQEIVNPLLPANTAEPLPDSGSDVPNGLQGVQEVQRQSRLPRTSADHMQAQTETAGALTSGN